MPIRVQLKERKVVVGPHGTNEIEYRAGVYNMGGPTGDAKSDEWQETLARQWIDEGVAIDMDASSELAPLPESDDEDETASAVSEGEDSPLHLEPMPDPED